MPGHRKLKKFLGGVVVVAIVAITLVVVVFLIKTKPEPKSQERKRLATLVDVQPVKTGAVRMNVVGYGTARAKYDLLLTAQVSGRITFLSPQLREGSRVKRDDVLLRIDPRPHQLAIASAEALLAQGEAQLVSLAQEKKNLEADLVLAQKAAELAKRSYDRSLELKQSGSESESMLDQADEAWVAKRSQLQGTINQLALLPVRKQAAEATLAQAQAQLDTAKLNLEYSEIRTPFDGYVSERLVESGQYVGVGMSLARIYDPRLLEISVQVSLEDYRWIEKAAFSDGESDTSGTAVVVRRKVGERVWHWKGHVVRLDSQIDRATRTAGLIVEVERTAAVGDASMKGDEAGPDLVPGLFLEVEVEGRSVDGVALVPRGAIDQEGRVFLAVDGKLALRAVDILRVMGETAYVGAGVVDGDLLIVSPMAAPVDGMAVRIARDGDKVTE